MSLRLIQGRKQRENRIQEREQIKILRVKTQRIEKIRHYNKSKMDILPSCSNFTMMLYMTLTIGQLLTKKYFRRYLFFINIKIGPSSIVICFGELDVWLRYP